MWGMGVGGRSPFHLASLFSWSPSLRQKILQHLKDPGDSEQRFLKLFLQLKKGRSEGRKEGRVRRREGRMEAGRKILSLTFQELIRRICPPPIDWFKTMEYQAMREGESYPLKWRGKDNTGEEGSERRSHRGIWGRMFVAEGAAGQRP